MTAPDDPVQNVVAGVAKEIIAVVLKQAEDFLAAVTGQEGKSLGTMLGSMLRRRKKRKNLIEVAAIAEEIRTETKITVVEIPLRILDPALEAAALEDDPDIQQKWACLLVNAANTEEVTPVGPMFPYILRDLGPKEVKFLDALYADALRKLETHPIFKDVSQMPYDLPYLMDLYVTLGFATAPNLGSPNFEEQQHTHFRRDRNAFFLMLDVIRIHDVIREVLIPREEDEGAHPAGPMKRVYHFSVLGVAFVKACHPPSKGG
jgi:hypothetical protein